MEKYTDNLKEYLKGRRNKSKKLYKIMSRIYRMVEKRRTTWDKVIEMTGGAN